MNKTILYVLFFNMSLLMSSDQEGDAEKSLSRLCEGLANPDIVNAVCKKVEEINNDAPSFTTFTVLPTVPLSVLPGLFSDGAATPTHRQKLSQIINEFKVNGSH